MKLIHYLALSLLLCCPLSASANTNDVSKTRIAHIGKSGKKGPMYSIKADLTDEQLETLVDKKNKYEAAIAQDKAQLKVEYRNLFNMITKPGADKKSILDLHEKLNDRKVRLSKARINFFLDSWEVMSIDQKKKLRRFVLERQLSSNHRRGHSRYGSRSSQKSASSQNSETSNETASTNSEDSSPALSAPPSAEEFLIMLAIQEE